jgi:hypothetical protein
MCKRLTCLTSILVMLVLAGSAVAQIDPATIDTGHVYLFDNITGSQLQDDSANSNTGTIIGDPEVVDSINSKALHFDGIDDGVSIPDSGFINITNGPWPNRTVVAVFKCDDVTIPDKQTIVDEGGRTRGLVIYVFEGELYVGGWNRSEYNWNPGSWLSAPIESDQWYSVALVIRDGGEAVEDDKFEMWMDGDLIGRAPGGQIHNHSDNNAFGYTLQNTVFHDNDGSGDDGWYFGGAIDEVWILNDALTETELQAWKIEPWPYASAPVPAHGAVYEATWVTLSWNSGAYAVSHNVYIGDNFDDVNEATQDSDLFRGNQTTDFYIAGFPGFAYPEGLVPGTTYYWRIDEVNDADPNSPWKGEVWRFTVPSLTAYRPEPPDRAGYIDPNGLTLTWAPGFGAKLHYAFFGDNFDDVNNAAVGLPQADATYTPTGLEPDKTYYWRVDEFDGFTTHKGDVWSFTTRPVIPITDPELLCWWKFDEGYGTTVLDWSGHGADGQFVGNPRWVDGYDGGALKVNGAGESAIYNFTDETWSAYTLAIWAKSNSLWQSNNSSICSTYLTTNGGFQLSYDAANSYQYHADVDQVIGPASLSWVHLAVTYNGTIATAYYNGEFVATFTPAADDLLANKYAVGVNRAEDNWFDGTVDDFRIYSRALSQEEIQYIMRGDPLVAWGPNPADGSNPDVDVALPLRWSPGDNASQHDVYFGLDEDALNAADATDTTGVYRGRQNATTYTPAEGVEWGGGPYYWRIDEVNTDGTLSRGKIWSFSVVDFILVDDFESYTDDDLNGEAIWQHWIDGFGVPGNGAQVGYLLPPYAEQNIVNNGNQSMPFLYDNTAGVTNSEAVLTLTAPRNWNREGLTTLSLWFRGNPASVGSFVEAPAGTYTMTGSGADIWTAADQFHFAYKILTGAGSIAARVNSISNTHAWAKAGVMIRETLDAGSKHAFGLVSSASGVAFQYRTDTDTAMTGTTEAGIAAPHWVKIERDAAGNFTVTHSANGTSWTSVASAVPVNIPMTSNVYIGLALTSHDAALTCQAVFSNVTTTGNVSGQWQHQDVGLTSNAAEPMYVQLANTNGATALVAHTDPAAATIDVWTEWPIPLQAFADQGVNLANVDSIAIGLGTKAGMATTGGSGTMYFDDIRLYPPQP